MSDNIDPAKVRLRNVRLSFPQLFQPKSIEEGKEPRYGANFLILKASKNEVAAIEKAMNHVIGAKWPKGRPKALKTSFKEASEKEYDGYDETCWVLNTSSVRRPAVVNPRIEPLTEKDGVMYPGCYVNASVRFFAFEHPVGGKGVSCELLAVQFAKDGESLGGHRPVKAEEEFEQLDESADDDSDDLI